MQRVELRVELHCKGCVEVVEGTLRDMPGVLELAPDLAGQRLVARIDGELMTLEALRLVLGDVGFPVQEVLAAEEEPSGPAGRDS